MGQYDKIDVPYTPVESIPKIVEELRQSFDSGKTRDIAFRKIQLKQLAYCIDDNLAKIEEALWRDLRKSKYEVALSETEVVKKEIVIAVKNLDSWAKPKGVKKDIAFLLNTAKVVPAPRGVACVISAWNYPVNLLLCPVVGAIAAGCTVIIKPSEVTSSVAKVITEIIPQYLDQSCYRVVNGGKDETSKLLEQKFDHVFYTGSGTVGKIVYEAAAKHLTPVVLELGGKSPAFVDNGSDSFLKLAAKRCIWGKMVNAGQTCIAPDYVVVDRQAKDAFIGHCKSAIEEMFGSDPHQSQEYCRMVTTRHWSRLRDLLKASSGKIVAGGQSDEADRYIAPTIVDCKKDDKLMEEEIFGPILPIITVNDVQDGVRLAQSKDRPLALYIFSNSNKYIKYVNENITAGGTTVNDTLMHFLMENLPFGGAGPSGIGSYHAKRSFDTFSVPKAYLTVPTILEPVLSNRYPPFTNLSFKILGLLVFKSVSFSRPSKDRQTGTLSESEVKSRMSKEQEKPKKKKKSSSRRSSVKRNGGPKTNGNGTAATNGNGVNGHQSSSSPDEAEGDALTHKASSRRASIPSKE